MNAYKELKDRHQKEMNAFPLGAAFSDKQFAEMMRKWGLTENDADKICSIGAGCFIRKCDKERFFEMLERFKRERKEAIAADKTGNGYIYDMFLYELANHEYCITYDLEETLDALGITVDEVNADKRLLHGLQKARKAYLKNCNDY
ncbi:MAG: hypothetical protein NC548_40490 [Lachnospiraceae bacterium]|nr:hypothetical protein [Lachnospiraceae bacterium]